MSRGDFFANEKSTTIDKATTARIEFIAEDGELTILKDQLPLETAEVVDTTFMSRKALDDFIDQQIVESKAQGVLFSLHLKATMMKVSDPKIFGHCVQVFYAPVLEKHEKTIKALGINLNNGIGDLFSKLKTDTHISPDTKTP